MKVFVGIYQEAVVRHGLHEKTTFIDWAIVDYIKDWIGYSGAKTFIDDNGTTYYWINFKHLIEEMPLLGISTKAGISKRITHLKNVGILDTFRTGDCSLGVRLTPLGEEILKFSKRPVNESEHPVNFRKHPVNFRKHPVNESLQPPLTKVNSTNNRSIQYTTKNNRSEDLKNNIDHPADDRACTSAPATQNSPKERRCICSTDILDEKNKKVFSMFWSIYPRKVGKGAAAKAWKNLKLRDGDRDLCKAILDGAKRMKEVATYTDKQFIPHPATWLNQRRWEDEDVPEPPRDRIVDPDRDVPMTEYVSLRGKISTMEDAILQRLDSLPEEELDEYKKLVLQNQKYKHLIDKWESKKRSKVS